MCPSCVSLSSSKTADERNAIQRQIDATDQEIDRLVYELYGLTDDEIRIVEEATRRAQPMSACSCSGGSLADARLTRYA